MVSYLFIAESNGSFSRNAAEESYCNLPLASRRPLRLNQFTYWNIGLGYLYYIMIDFP